VSSREERPGRWDPEAPGASGGHLAPDVAATGPLFDPVTGAVTEVPAPAPDPWTEDAPSGPAEPGGVRTDVAPGSRPGVERRPGPVRRRIPVRRVKRTIRHVNPFSILKLSLFFYAAFLILWLVFVAILYWILGSFGFWDSFEDFRRDLVLWEDVKISLFWVERWAFMIGLLFVVVGVLVNTFLAFLYNFGADTVGGVEVTFVERDF
jgi:hypothetical protein